MPDITYSSRNFKAPYTGKNFIGSNTLPVPWGKLMHAAVTVGKADATYLNKHGVLSRYERKMRMYMVKVNFRETVEPKSALARFQHTEVYKSLDPSEKTALSYFTGLTIAKVLASHFLKVPWLQHYDGYIPLAKGVRPDLLGMNSKGRFVIMEAKGRTGSATEELMNTAKGQTKKPPFINDSAGKKQRIIARVASASYASKAGILSARWEDPEETDLDAPSSVIEPLDFLRQYYEPIRTLIDFEAPGTLEEKYEGYTFITRFFPEVDVTVGLLNKPLDFYMNESSDLPDSADSEWYTVFHRNHVLNNMESVHSDSRELFFGADGVFIALGSSWNSENMQKEPKQRIHS